MKILKMKVKWNEGFANSPELEILVDEIPNRDELVYDSKGRLYYAEKNGYVSFFCRDANEPGRGFGGREFVLKMRPRCPESSTQGKGKCNAKMVRHGHCWICVEPNCRGTVKLSDLEVEILKGPWSSRASVMNGAGFKPCLDVAMTDDPESYERGHTFMAGHVTLQSIYEGPMEMLDNVYLIEVHNEGDITWIPSVDPDVVMKPGKKKEEKLSQVQEAVLKEGGEHTTVKIVNTSDRPICGKKKGEVLLELPGEKITSDLMELITEKGIEVDGMKLDYDPAVMDVVEGVDELQKIQEEIYRTNELEDILHQMWEGEVSDLDILTIVKKEYMYQAVINWLISGLNDTITDEKDVEEGRVVYEREQLDKMLDQAEKALKILETL